MYNENEIKQRILKRRKMCITALSLNLLTLAAGIVLLVLDVNNSLFFFGIIAITLSLILIFTVCNKYSFRILFSKELSGKNIKENVYEIYVRRGVALAPKQAGMGYGGTPLSHTRMAKAQLRSSVYLKTDNGNIREIRGLRVEHTELYEDGDLLFKYAGTKYPVIKNRESERQPCPICGSINLVKDETCIHCGLKISN